MEAAEHYCDQRVSIPRGAEVRSLHPHSPAGWYPAGRAQTVTVCDVALDEDLETVLLLWPGSGGYWKDVRASDVVLA